MRTKLQPFFKGLGLEHNKSPTLTFFLIRNLLYTLEFLVYLHKAAREALNVTL